MLLPLSCHRRDLGRSARARLHRDAAARRRVGAQWHVLLAGTARRECELERSADALADRKCIVADQRARSSSTWPAGLGCRTVPHAWIAAGPLEPRP